MKISKPPANADIVLSLEFDETLGAMTVSFSCRPAVNLGAALSYLLTREEAKQIAGALGKWANLS